ncbi:MAG: redoxin domain-containing protein [Gemmatimonadetes bacterium]|nr:redoxin domain-containing protein [Gemmatimonadota bacterium]
MDPDDGDGAPTFVELLGPSLVTADGSSVGTQALQGKALVGVYFAAGWCPACAAFTPLLVSAYGEWRKADRSFEIVLASLDHSSPEMFSHMKARGMGWLAIPYDAARIRALAERYAVQWIPTLIVMDGDRTIITTGGRDDVAAKGAAAFDAWLAASQGR